MGHYAMEVVGGLQLVGGGVPTHQLCVCVCVGGGGGPNPEIACPESLHKATTSTD